MKLLNAIVLALLLTSVITRTALALVQGEETRGPDGLLTGLVRDSSGVLRTKGDGVVVKFACSSADVPMPNEVEATTIGAPACPDGLKATRWDCVANTLIAPGQRGITQREQGEPDCGKQFTAIRHPVFAPNQAPHAGPPPPDLRTGDPLPPPKPISSNRSDAPDQAAASTSLFHYVQAKQTNVATPGLSATLSVERPYVHPAAGTHFGHSLGQIAAAMYGTGIAVLDTVETGWHVDYAVEGDYQPHLFVERKVNGSYVDGNGNSCYNKCEFQPISKIIKPGMLLKPGMPAIFSIMHQASFGSYSSGWHVFYGTEDVGYYPDTAWTSNGGTPFTSSNYIAWYGEVYDSLNPPVTGMGNGRWGTDSSAAAISSMAYYDYEGSLLPASPSFYISDPSYYSKNN